MTNPKSSDRMVKKSLRLLRVPRAAAVLPVGNFFAVYNRSGEYFNTFVSQIHANEVASNLNGARA